MKRYQLANFFFKRYLFSRKKFSSNCKINQEGGWAERERENFKGYLYCLTGECDIFSLENENSQEADEPGLRWKRRKEQKVHFNETFTNCSAQRDPHYSSSLSRNMMQMSLFGVCPKAVLVQNILLWSQISDFALIVHLDISQYFSAFRCTKPGALT